jgi:hypothetical protein
MNQPSSNIYHFNSSSDKESNIRDRTIYHYTSPDALIDIISKNEIRFTDCQFLNDRSEYNHILEPLNEAMTQVKSSLHDTGLEQVIFNHMETDYQEKHLSVHKNKEGGYDYVSYPSRYYVFCASTDSDSLNMWNYYIKNGSYQGYNIGLSVNKIVEQVPQSIVDNVLYGGVIYDNKEKINLLASLILETDSKLFTAKQRPNASASLVFETEDIFTNLFISLQNYRLFFKNKVFEGEKEYRIAIQLPQTDNDHSPEGIRKGFTSKHGAITPHFDLKFPKDSLKRINLSPMLEHELAIEGLHRLLENNKYNSKFEIKKSAIPIRY